MTVLATPREPTAIELSPAPASGDVDMSKKKWSQDVTEHSDALDLDEGVFKQDDPAKIAQSLKRSAEYSKRRKGTPLQSAMGMLTFYINRAGDNLGKHQRKVLEDAKDELRKAFGKEPHEDKEAAHG
ncbi:DUF3175 domain-containing protein [Novosphingobium fluoreni]|uniref:DUF3175 domain-containing protein n=1 Tax=Novosphingobium fluoreni TaxID=1391222 RepID=UPI001FA7819C